MPYPFKTQSTRSCRLDIIIRFCFWNKHILWLWSTFYFELANLALFSNTTKTRLLLICRKKVSKRGRTLTEEIFQLMNKSD
ncbi:UNVERIFIED_CONTAM: hypothetical protein NCL1_27777 [Trichonephila clavipes]